MVVACDVDGHASNGMKVRTMYGGTVDPHMATICIVLDWMVGTMVPSAFGDVFGSLVVIFEWKTGTCGLAMV